MLNSELNEFMHEYFPGATLKERVSTEGKPIIEIIHYGEVPKHFFSWITEMMNNSILFIDRDFSLGKPRLMGVISQYLKERYEVLVEKRRLQCLAKPKSLKAFKAYDEASNHNDRVYYLYTHPWDKDSFTYSEYVQSTQGGK